MLPNQSRRIQRLFKEKKSRSLVRNAPKGKRIKTANPMEKVLFDLMSYQNLLKRGLYGNRNEALLQQIKVDGKRVINSFYALFNTGKLNGAAANLYHNALIHRFNATINIGLDLIKLHKDKLPKEWFAQEITELRGRFQTQKINVAYIRRKLSRPFEYKVDDLGEVIQDIVVRGRYFAKAKNIKIKFKTDGSIVSMPVDIAEEIAFELVQNSIYHLSKNGTIRVSAFNRQGKLIVTVEDNGAGISKENLVRLQRKERFSTRKGGTGSGLSIIQEMLNYVKGTMQIESQQGKGTKVIITIPTKDIAK